jgi:hypothetical protein
MSQKHLLAQDIPYRKGKVGARKAFPRKCIIKAPYLYDIQENHIRLGLFLGHIYYNILKAKKMAKNSYKKHNNR